VADAEADGNTFIHDTFAGIFYTPDDLRFLDRAWAGLRRLPDGPRDVLLAALLRACAKRQPRGVFTVADPGRYVDGRRDLALSLREHFVEQAAVYAGAVFDNGRANRALQADALTFDGRFDLVYLDPPYVPRADDNCYVKRYHFLEGLACRWEGVEILPTSRVRKLRKSYTPFSYRRTAVDAFTALFERWRDSMLVLSYSSNGWPDLDVLTALMQRVKPRVEVHARPHRYHFGTHAAARRRDVQEYLVVGR
jgi:adenine-specific DNA-methyltransferase